MYLKIRLIRICNNGVHHHFEEEGNKNEKVTFPLKTGPV
jgi:hypothetical protein